MIFDMADRKNLKMVISYDGSGYLGWQRLGGTQKKKSIQSCLEIVLQEILNMDIKIAGSGRTDAGVHAKGQVANFYVPSSFLTDRFSLQKLKQDCNYKLPDDIQILSIEEVENDFHSRYSAISKTYNYYLDTREVPCVFSRKYALWVGNVLDVDLMRECSNLFLGEHDFRGFSSEKDMKKDTIRRIYNISFKREKHLLAISITGDGFLYNMVRIIIGTLLEVGRRERTLEQVHFALDNPRRKYAGVTVSSVGLVLYKVDYNNEK